MLYTACTRHDSINHLKKLVNGASDERARTRRRRHGSRWIGSTVLRELRPSPNDESNRRTRPLVSPAPRSSTTLLPLLRSEAAAALLGPASELPAGSFCGFRPRPPAKQSMEKERVMGSCAAPLLVGNLQDLPYPVLAASPMMRPSPSCSSRQDASCSSRASGSATPPVTTVRQSGQLTLWWSQVSMQSMWKAWEALGSCLRRSSCANSARQTAHSSADDAEIPARGGT